MTSENLSRELIKPTENDVLCGRGSGIFNHPGNVIYRNLVEGKKRQYLSCRFKLDKRLIAQNIVKEIHRLNPPGRFLSKDDTSGEWYDIGNMKARDKTLQALREHAPEVRKKIEEEKAAELEKARQNEIQDEDEARLNAQCNGIADRERQEREYRSRQLHPLPPPPPPPWACAHMPPQNESPPCATCNTFTACACRPTVRSSPSYPSPVHQMPISPMLPISHPHNNILVPPPCPYQHTNIPDIYEGADRSAHVMPQHGYPVVCHGHGYPHMYQPPPLHPLPVPPQVEYIQVAERAAQYSKGKSTSTSMSQNKRR